MIRPVTIATFLLACGSGLYLYQSKHEVQMLDHTIERTVRETAALRDQSRNLATEWTMLNDPARLRQFSDTYLHLASIEPKQFTSLADLGSKLPQPEPPAVAEPVVAEPTAATETGVSVAEGGEGADDVESAAATADAGAAPVTGKGLPTPPAMPVVAIGVARPADHALSSHGTGTDAQPQHRAQAAETRLADTHPAQPAHAPELRGVETRVTDARPARQQVAVLPVTHTAEQPAVSRPAQTPSLVTARPVAAPRVTAVAAVRPVVSAAASRPISLANSSGVTAQERPVMSAPPVVPTAAPIGGSLLGMAHGATPPAPRPTPVNAFYNAN